MVWNVIRLIMYYNMHNYNYTNVIFMHTSGFIYLLRFPYYHCLYMVANLIVHWRFVILLIGLITNVIAFLFLCYTTSLYIMLHYYTCTYLHATVKSV